MNWKDYHNLKHTCGQDFYSTKGIRSYKPDPTCAKCVARAERQGRREPIRPGRRFKSLSERDRDFS